PWADTAYGIAQAREFTARSEQAWDSGAEFAYAMVLTDDAAGPVLGSAGLHRRIGEGGLEIGYWVHADHVRRGRATLASALLTEAALALPNVTHVQIHHDPANTASGAVPARLGFVLIERRERPPEAPAETPYLNVWRLTAADYPTSAVPAVLAAAR
ncbi:MAG TPA: GNAT family N-acetyltransferase, partial [Cryptosporangiaceae bacterium]|nr:GNAT family N-acetyltransferase [Cryptosporangiaceae bacterium]